MTGLVGRDSDDLIKWHRPKSVGDAVEQASFNCFCGCVICWGGIYVCLRTCCGLRKPHFVEDRRAAETRRQNTVRSLPTIRKRAITLPLPEPTMERSRIFKQIVDEQVSSRLLTQLPLEVRQLIWKHVISGGGQGLVLHIFQRGQKMCHWRCRKLVNDQPCSWNDPCSEALPQNSLALTESGRYVGDPRKATMQQYDNSKIEPDEPEKLLSLLLSCRKIYSEIIMRLYSLPHFHFPDATDLISFRSGILPQRLNSVRSLSLDWSDIGFDHPYSRRQWETIFDLISGMRDLQELRICAKLLVLERDCRQMKIMQSLMGKVMGLKVFELVVPNDQLRFWEGFLSTDGEARLVGLPKRVLRNVFDGRNENIIA